MITLKHKDKQIVTDGAEKLAMLLKQDMKQFITGPAEPVVGRVRNRYLMEILIKLPRETRISALKQVIKNHIQLLLSEKRFASIQVIPDVDAN